MWNMYLFIRFYYIDSNFYKFENCLQLIFKYKKNFA